VRRLLSSEHFSVDGTLVEAWASMKSFKPRVDAGVNGGDKADHSAVQIQAIGRAPSGMTLALTR
jgi:hypothetical protein